MIHMILRFFILSLSIYIIALIIPGIRLKSFKSALSVAAIYGLLNFLLFKVLIFITFPLVILKYLTLGVAGVIFNAILLMITDKILEDFEMSGFGAALAGALGISVVNLLLSLLFGALSL